MIASKKVQVDDMLTHKFPLEKYREMIDVNPKREAQPGNENRFQL